MRRKSHLWLVLPDAHFPEHDVQAMNCALRINDVLRPDKILVLGDWLDNAPFKRHPEVTIEQKGKTYTEIIADVNRHLDLFQKHGADLVFIEGNHEAWVERWCVQNAGIAAPDIFSAMSPKALLADHRKRCEWVSYVQGSTNHYAIADDFWAVHGWSAAANAAAAHMRAAPGISIVHGHTHRGEMKRSRSLVSGRPIVVWSPGCLAQLQMKYMSGRPSQHTHGVGLVYQSKKNPEDWTEYNVTIHEGRCILPDGTEIKEAA